MKYLFAFLVISIVSLSHAAVVSLPRGGNVTVDTKEWNVQETRALTGVNSLFIGHRTEKDLQGVILDGTVNEKGQCGQDKTMFCERLVPMGDKLSYQIVGQRYHGPNTFQNYVIAFNIPKDQEKKYLPILKKLKSGMEFSK